MLNSNSVEATLFYVFTSTSSTAVMGHINNPIRKIYFQKYRNFSSCEMFALRFDASLLTFSADRVWFFLRTWSSDVSGRVSKQQLKNLTLLHVH